MRSKFYLSVFSSILLVFGIFQLLFALNSNSNAFYLPFFTSKNPEPNQQDTLINQNSFRILNDIAIPIREGFPFCETFIGFDPRPNAIWDGSLMSGAPNPNVQLTGDALQLTSNGTDENGYVFVDIPFSSAFGLKVSFEFSSFGGTGADGFSFFMFDGTITAADFDIGGTGGALGYTPVKFPNDDTPTLLTPGLKGAYIGIGFDELGNFGNSRDGRNGGFEDPVNGPNTQNRPLFKHSVVIRGPSDGDPSVPLRDRDRTNDFKNGFAGVRWDSYKFIDGRIFDPAATGTAVTSVVPPVTVDVSAFLHPDRFELDTDSFSDSCPDEGFRKVFIDLNPIDINDRSKGYQVEIQMLVNDAGLGGVRLINVFNGPINYPFGAPELLKVGFAAATGASTNFHHIRNVTVQVSNEDVLEKPLVEPLIEEVCEGETNTFELDVQLRNDTDNAFIRCLQLYYTEQEAFDVLAANGISIPFPPAGDVNSLCPTGNCVDLLCRPERTSRPAYDNITGELAGQFEVFLVVENGKEVPKVRFVATPGYSGETTMYYTVTDNFGQVSDPKPITITINAQPEPIITTLDPLAWEQQEINNIRVLLESNITDPTYSYQWFKDGVLIPGATATTYLATTPGDYDVEVSTPQGCVGLSAEAVTIILVENLEPNFQDSPVPETCSALGLVKVTFKDFAVSGIDANGNPGNEKWKIITESGAVIQDWTFLSAGQNEVVFTGLAAGKYVFLIGDEFRSGQPGSDGNPLYRHYLPFEILQIQTPLQLVSAVPSPELCFGEGGELTVQVSGGEGPGSYTFSLTNQATGQVLLPGSVSGGTANFLNVPQGNYTLEANSSTRCTVTDNVSITGPASPLNLNLVDADGISCGIADSGFIQWQVQGGTPPYSLVSLTRNGTPVANPSLTQTNGLFDFQKLVAGQYIFTVRDANNCELVSSPVDLAELPAPVFEIEDIQICEDDPALLTINIVELSNSEPDFEWINHEGNPITSSGTINGITYNFIPDADPITPDDLEIIGLAPGQYEFTLKITGSNICTQPDQKAIISVNPKPVVEEVLIENLSCFESGDGKIEVRLDAGLDPKDYSFELLGFGPPQDSNLFENLDAGVYEIRVINKNTACINSLVDLEITQPDLLELINISQIDPSCDQSNGSISFSIIGGTESYTVLINGQDISEFSFTNSGSDYVLNNLEPNDYLIEVVDDNSCEITSPVITLVNDPKDPVAVDSMTDLICEGNEAEILPNVTTPGVYTLSWFKDSNATQPISSTTVPDGNGWTYQVDSSTGKLTVSGLKAGQSEFFLLVTGPDICPIPPFKAIVDILSPIELTLDIQDEICIGASDGVIIVNATGADGNFEYSIDNGPFGSSNTFSNLAPGNYTIAVRSTGSNGCEAQISGTVAGPQAPITINTPDIIRNSCDLPNGAIENLQISGGWGAYTVEWRRGSLTGAVVPGDLTGAQNLISDTYYLIVEDAKGCVVNFNFVVSEMPDPNFVIAPVEVCAGETVTLTPVNTVTGSAPTEIKWYKDAAKSQEITNGPDSSNPSILYEIDPNTDHLSITGLSGNAQAYTYYFNVLCTNQLVEAKALVREVPAPVFSTNPVACFNGNDGKIEVSSGGNPNFVYSVDNGPSLTESQLASQNFAAGIYSIKVNNQGFCEQVFTVEVEQPSAALAISPLVKLDPACGQDIGKITTQISGGWAPYTVTLNKNGVASPPQTVQGPSFEAVNLSPGDYSITVVDKEGCSITSNTIQLVYGPTTIEVTDAEICEGEQVVLKPTASPNPTGATFEWYKDSNLTQKIVSNSSPDSNGHIFNIASDGTLTVEGLSWTNSPITYYVILNGGNSCPGFVESAEVKINRIPTLSAQIENEICFGDKGQIILTGGEGDGTFTYSLDGITFQSGSTFDVDPGTYTGYVKSGSGCVVSLPNLLVLGPSSALTLGSPIIKDSECNASNGSVSFDIDGGYGQYTIDVTRNGTAYSSTSFAGGTYNSGNIPPGSYQFVVTDAGGCSVSLAASTEIRELPTPLSSTDDVICVGETAALIPSTTQTGINPTFTWYSDPQGTNPISSGTSNGISYQIASNGTLSITGLQGRDAEYLYYVKISGANICESDLVPAKVKVYPLPNLRVSNPSIVCDPSGTVDLTLHIEGFNPSLYDYQVISPNGSAMKLDDIDQVSLSGNYLVSSSIKGANCWTPNQRIQVRIAEEELISNFEYQADLGGGIFLPNDVAQMLEPVNFTDLSTGDAIIWNWDFGDGNTSSSQNPTHIFTKKGLYTVSLTTIDSIGCISVIEKVIEVKDDYTIIIPNAFTPDGVKNQYFKPQFRGIATVEYFIFNTWGELLFHTTNAENPGWDGTINGQKAPGGNYVYRAVFTTRSNEKIERSGVFLLIR